MARQEQGGAAPAKLTCGMTRRTFALGAGGLVVCMGLGGVKLLPAQAVVRPPGGQDEDAFLAGCTRCEKCVEACPNDAIKLCHIEDGLVNMRTPQMDFYSNYCDFCQQFNGGNPRCVAACVTGALKLEDGATAQNTIIGKAQITQDWCLAYMDMGCHKCYDVCPYGAIELDQEGRPYVIDSKCNGCGACEAACVSLTNGSRSAASDATSRAIVVKAQEA